MMRDWIAMQAKAWKSDPICSMILSGLSGLPSSKKLHYKRCKARTSVAWHFLVVSTTSQRRQNKILSARATANPVLAFLGSLSVLSRPLQACASPEAQGGHVFCVTMNGTLHVSRESVRPYYV